MKWIMVVSVVVGFSCSALAGEVTKQDFKCYVETTIDKQVVFYRWDINKVARLMAALPATQTAKNAQGNKAYIKSVAECVVLDKDFSTEKAQRLDYKTVR
ncbi:TapY2 family type IVa secretion system protein [Shewanella abyssi]|uniref:TapY2 family type IVa secretion system protein n=1 Tax=Shewanella abyssi TaxID=311789 RepID=UPI0020103578|nr:TapY2 family type IVa secretion system protein [Shewanella abyssi]MCL1051241.1 TapY2 family type IVa secretion system protein [Shewanella abyssi]